MMSLYRLHSGVERNPVYSAQTFLPPFKRLGTRLCITLGYSSLVPRPPPAFFEFMKKSSPLFILQAIKAGDKTGDEARVMAMSIIPDFITTFG